jgi:hypothetical protein
LNVELLEGLSSSIGIAAGGEIRQKIYPDPFGVDVWDRSKYVLVSINILNTYQFRQITGLDPEPSPIGVDTYIESGLPWFEIYDEQYGDISPSEKLSSISSTTNANDGKAPHQPHLAQAARRNVVRLKGRNIR